jgi:hypothetical protein
MPEPNEVPGAGTEPQASESQPPASEPVAPEEGAAAAGGAQAVEEEALEAIELNRLKGLNVAELAQLKRHLGTGRLSAETLRNINADRTRDVATISRQGQENARLKAEIERARAASQTATQAGASADPEQFVNTLLQRLDVLEKTVSGVQGNVTQRMLDDSRTQFIASRKADWDTIGDTGQSEVDSKVKAFVERGGSPEEAVEMANYLTDAILHRTEATKMASEKEKLEMQKKARQRAATGPGTPRNGGGTPEPQSWEEERAAMARDFAP